MFRRFDLQVCSSIISVCCSSTSDELSSSCDQMEVEESTELCLAPDQSPILRFGAGLSRHLALGLADNWSQVRLAASVAVKHFLLALPPDL